MVTLEGTANQGTGRTDHIRVSTLMCYTGPYLLTAREAEVRMPPVRLIQAPLGPLCSSGSGSNRVLRRPWS